MFHFLCIFGDGAPQVYGFLPTYLHFRCFFNELSRCVNLTVSDPSAAVVIHVKHNLFP